MAPPARLSRHALQRVGDRLSATPDDVTAILDHDLAVLLGTDSGRLHRLFYSPADDQCFVAIQDEENGDVVTVLPLDYHSSLAWEVSLEAQEEAERLLLGSTRSATRVAEAGEPPSGPGLPNATTGGVASRSGVFRVGCYVLTSEGQPRARGLGSMSLARVGGDLSSVSKSDDVLAEIRQRVAERLRKGEALDVVFVKRRDETVIIDDSRRWNR